MKQKNFMKMMAVMLTMSMLGTTPVMAGEGEEKVTLTIEMSQDMKAQNNEAVNEEIYAAFEEKYPNIEVEEILVPDAQYKNVVSTKISAGEPSDIIICNRLNGQTDYNAKENMLDLSDMEFVSRMKDPSIVTDDDGVIRCYQPKYSNEGSCIVYNKTLLISLAWKFHRHGMHFLMFVRNCRTTEFSLFTAHIKKYGLSRLSLPELLAS